MSERRHATERAVVEILSYLPVLGPLAAFTASVAFFSSTAENPFASATSLDAYLPFIAAGGLIGFPAGTYFLMDGVHRLAQARAARSWTQTTGEILSSAVSATGVYRHFRTPMVSFRYVAAGSTYEGDDIQTARAVYLSESAAAGVAARYPVGSTVPVHYDPQKPGVAVLEISDSAARRRIWHGVLLFLAPVVIGVAMVLYNRML